MNTIIDLVKENCISRGEEYMEFIKPFILIVCFCLVVACSGEESYEFSDKDKEQIVIITNEYYQNFMHLNYSQALNYLDIKENNIEREVRINTLNELEVNSKYRINWREAITINDVSFDKNKKTPFLATVISVMYKNSELINISEILYFSMENGEWRIKKIESRDPYLSYRANKI